MAPIDAAPTAPGSFRILILTLLLAGLQLGRPDVAPADQPPGSNGRDADAEWSPKERPSLQVTDRQGAIEIDGDLTDPGWQGAARATDFSETFPEERGKPPVRSEVWVTYDESNLYLAFLAYDDPSSLRASLRDRDEMWSDDYFGVLIDTYGDAAWAYFLFANPLGVQGDSRFATAGGEDDGFDIIYEAEARITEIGYQIEMAIPFASLRFPDREVQTWRVNFWRTRPRGSRATYSWAALDRDEQCFLCQFGTLTGIEGAKPGGALELLPSVVASQSGALQDASDPRSGFDEGGLDGEVSLGARYAFTSGLTAEASFNPDFSQVESDVAQIDVNTTFALFFPERRPFFQEGSDLFETFFDVVYTRQINDPQFATKLVGRLGRTNVAYMAARDENSPLLLPFQERSFIGQAARSISNIARVRQTFGSRSYVGALITDRRFENGGGSGTVAGVDGVFRLFDNYRLEYQLLASHTREPDAAGATSDLEGETFDGGRHTGVFDGESFWGYAQYTSFERSARHWEFDFDYWASSPTFRADNGFESRNDYRRVSMWQGVTFWPGTALVDRFTPGVYVQRNWNWDGVRKRQIIEPNLSFSLTAQTSLNFWYDIVEERFGGVDFGNVNHWGMFVNSNFSDPVRLGFFLSTGRSIARNEDPVVLGEGTNGEVFATFKPIQRLVIQPSVQFAELSELRSGDQIFSGYILRMRSTFQFTRELFLRLVVQYNDFAESLSVEPLLTYKVNPFTLFFIGATSGYENFDDPNEFAQTSRQFFAKFQYLFRM